MYHPTIEDVQTVVNKLNERYKIDATIINKSQLEFILEKPQMHIFGQEQYPKLYQKAAVLMEGLTKIHALSDGNKRCAMMLAEFMINYNGAELVMPLKAVRLSVDTAMDEDDKMTEEIQQWFKVHIANNRNQLTILLLERVAEESIITNLLNQNRSREAEDLVGKWLAFDSYPEHRIGWSQLTQKWKRLDPNTMKDDQTKIFTTWQKYINPYNQKYHASFINTNINNTADLIVVNHTLEELVCYEQEIQRVEKSLANTHDAKMLFAQALVLGMFGYFTEALECNKKMLKIDPTQHDFYHYMALLYAGLQNYERSVVIFKQYLKLNPHDAGAHSEIARVLNDLNKNEDALGEINKSIEIEPRESESHYVKSVIQIGLGDFKGAKKSIEYALKIKPTKSDYLELLGRILIEIGRYNEAVEVLEVAIEKEPKSMLRVHYMAHAYALMKKYDKAVQYYQLVLQNEPGNHEALFNIGVVYLKLRRYTKALEYLKKGLVIDPASQLGLDSMGFVLMAIGKHDDALKYLKQSIELDDEDMQPVFNKLKTFVKQNKVNRALSVLGEIYKKHHGEKL